MSLATHQWLLCDQEIEASSYTASRKLPGCGAERVIQPLGLLVATASSVELLVGVQELRKDVAGVKVKLTSYQL